MSALATVRNKSRKGKLKQEIKGIKGASRKDVNVAMILHTYEKGEQGSLCRDIKKNKKNWKVTQEIILQKDRAISLFLFSFFALLL